MKESSGALNLVDILDIAVGMERRAVEFYREAVERFGTDEEKTRALLAMGRMEEEHVVYFRDLLEKASALTGVSPAGHDEIVEIDYTFWFDKSLYEMDEDLSTVLKSLKTKKEILLFALEMENRSILFYSGLRRYCEDVSVWNIINQIIKEEYRHGYDLVGMLPKL